MWDGRSAMRLGRPIVVTGTSPAAGEDFGSCNQLLNQNCPRVHTLMKLPV